MRKLVLIGMTVALGGLGVPAGASAFTSSGTTCDYAKSTAHGGNETTSAKVLDDGTNQVYVYEGAGSSGTADAAVGVCVYVPNSSGVNGGRLEAGAGFDKGVSPTDQAPAPLNTLPPPPVGVYAVEDGDDSNTVDGGATGATSAGYVGVSNYETDRSTTWSCSRGERATGGTNSGGCFNTNPNGFPGLVPLWVPLIICGEHGGTYDWNQEYGDGCFIQFD